MIQQPFTPAGIEAKQTELYALSDTELYAQSDLIRYEFSDWVADNFELNTSQQSFFDSLSVSFIYVLSTQISTAVRFRLPVGLGVPAADVEVAPSPAISKRLNVTNTIGAASETADPSGRVDLSVTYE